MTTTRVTPASHLTINADGNINEAVTRLRELAILANTVADHLESRDHRAVMAELRRLLEGDDRGDLSVMAREAERYMTNALVLKRSAIQVGLLSERGDK